MFVLLVLPADDFIKCFFAAGGDDIASVAEAICWLKRMFSKLSDSVFVNSGNFGKSPADCFNGEDCADLLLSCCMKGKSKSMLREPQGKDLFSNATGLNANADDERIGDLVTGAGG